MKPINYIFTALLFLAGCTFSSDKMDAPSGTFARNMKSEFSIANDTVVIVAQNDGWVSVMHRTAFYRIKEDGSMTDTLYKTSSFQAAFEAAQREFVNPKTGGRYAFPKGSNMLVYNGASYKLVQ